MEKIVERVDFVKNFVSKNLISKTKIILMNATPLEELFPLKFIDMITEYPNYTFGQPIYNNSLNFYTYLIDFFCKFYLEKDLQTFEKINAEDIQSYSPTARLRLRNKNIKNSFLRDKYFNDDFNLHKFALKLVAKFVPGCNWRWIGGNHKAHIYCVKICKILIEYGLLNDYECDEIKDALYAKILVYRNLEQIIDNDSKTINVYWIDVWFDGLLQIREFYSETLIHYLYFKLDNDLGLIMQNAYQECTSKAKSVTLERLKQIINFDKIILFENDFGFKIMDLLHGYILSQNTINQKLLTSVKLETIANNFLNLFSNVKDSYLYSIKLIREEDYISYAKDELKISKPNEELTQDVAVFVINLKNIISGFGSGKYYKNENQILSEVLVLFDKIDEKINYIEAIQNNDPKSVAIQKILFNSNIHVILTNLIANLLNDYTELVQAFNKKSGFLSKFSNLIAYYLNDNIEFYSIFLSEKNVYIFEDMLYKSPVEISEILFEVVSTNSIILITKNIVLEDFLDIFDKLLKNLPSEPTAENYQVLSKIIALISLYINPKLSKFSEWIPEYDIVITQDLTEKKEFLKAEDYEEMLKKYKNNKNTLNDAKLQCYMRFLSLLSMSTAFRFYDFDYKIMDESFSMDKLMILINLCEENLEFRSIFMDLYSNLHVDLKNHLLSNRSDYYFTKPTDMQYEEDQFFDKEYQKTIDLFMSEFTFIFKLFENKSKQKKNQIVYLNSSVFTPIIKLTNYFLTLTKENLKNITKYLEKLDEFKDFLIQRKDLFSLIYGIDPNAIDITELEKYKNNLSLFEFDSNIKLNKLKLLGICKVIYEFSTSLIKLQPLQSEKRKTISYLTTKHRKNMSNSTQLMSNLLSERKENLNFPFENRENNTENKNKKFKITTFFHAFYEFFKKMKVSIEPEKNVYLISMKDEKNQEMMTLCKNFCAFIHNQLKDGSNNAKYSLVEIFIYTIFISTKSIQANLLKIIQDSGESSTFLDNLWDKMKKVMSIVKFKTTLDQFWEENFQKCMILIKFHQYLCEDNSINFKKLMSEAKLKNDKIDRVQRWTTILQRMSDEFEWHLNYVKGEINDFEKFHKAHLFNLAVGVFDNLAELCSGPCTENQKKIYTYIWDRYIGLFQRYWRDSNTDFYKMKLSFMDFVISLIEGENIQIINYQISQIELNNIFFVAINSLKQAFYCIVKKDAFDKKNMSDYVLKMTDFTEIEYAFYHNEKFSKHTLISLCIKIFTYIKNISGLKSKYDIFCNEREEMIQSYEKNPNILTKSIKEEDLVTYKFLSKVLTKIEVVGEKDAIFFYYFPLSSKTRDLSDYTKEYFLKNIDRSSLESKLSGLCNEINYFDEEMKFNQTQINNPFRRFGYGNFWFLQKICFCITIFNNLMLFIDDTSFIQLFAIIEIILSIISILLFLFSKYPVIRRLNWFRFQNSKDSSSQTSNAIYDLYDKIWINYFDSFFLHELVWVFFYHIFCLSLGLWNVAFITFDVFTAINLFDTMKIIIKSVTMQIRQLLSTLVLAALSIFCFSYIITNYFLQEFDVDSCSSFSRCFFYIIDQAFTNGQGIAGLANSDSGDSSGTYYWLFLFNLAFFLLINTILLNVILAILLDTFSSLREKEEVFGKF